MSPEERAKALRSGVCSHYRPGVVPGPTSGDWFCDTCVAAAIRAAENEAYEEAWRVCNTWEKRQAACSDASRVLTEVMAFIRSLKTPEDK